MKPTRLFQCSQHLPTLPSHPYPEPDKSNQFIYGPLHNFQISCQIPISQVVRKATFNCEVVYNISYNVDSFCGEEVLFLRKTPNPENHPLSPIRECLVYSQLLSISGGCHLHQQSDDAPCRGDSDHLVS
jgi:hypothetical protein